MTRLVDRLYRMLTAAFQSEPDWSPRFRAQLEQLEDRAVPACLSPDPFICNPLPSEGQVVHIHPFLEIKINGQQQTIPTNIGISPSGFNPIHTHSDATTGKLHVESPVERVFYLRDFFDTWGFAFSRQEVMGFYTDAARPVTMTVNGQPNTEFGALVLNDGDRIVVQANNAFPLANMSMVATSFTHSNENYRNFITNAYRKYLGRTPDSVGLNGWVDKMRAGVTDEQVEANFIGSPEYIRSHGGTGEAWVKGMYQDLLGRQPDQAGLQGWVTRLSNGTKPYDVAYGFAASPEREGIRVREIYATFLGRGASQSEVKAWVDRFVAGARQEAVVAGFLGSREYFNNPDKGRGDRTIWLKSAYRDILRRDAGPAEVNAWLEKLNRSA